MSTCRSCLLVPTMLAMHDVTAFGAVQRHPTRCSPPCCCLISLPYNASHRTRPILIFFVQQTLFSYSPVNFFMVDPCMHLHGSSHVAMRTHTCPCVHASLCRFSRHISSSYTSSLPLFLERIDVCLPLGSNESYGDPAMILVYVHVCVCVCMHVCV